MATLLVREIAHFLLLLLFAIMMSIFLVEKSFATSTKKELHCADCGGERIYFWYAGDAVKPKHLFIVLHGYKSTAKNTISRTRRAFENLAHIGQDRIVIHADALERNWAIGDSGSGSRNYDIAYFEALWREAKTAQRTLQHIHLVGLSRGAMASFVLACQTTLPIASLTVYAMSMPEYSAQNCPQGRQIDFHMVHGTKDLLVPYGGGKIRMPWYLRNGAPDFGTVLGADDTLTFWQLRNGCTSDDPKHKVLDARYDGTSVEQRLWANCPDGAVSYTRIDRGGHRWPNELWSPLSWILLGKTTREIPTNMQPEAIVLK